MPKATKMPSGNWRAKVYSYTDDTGKKHFESFTRPTKREAESAAAAYMASRDRRAKKDYTVEEILDMYLKTRESALSASTLRGYETEVKRLRPIFKKRVNRLTSDEIQAFVDSLLLSHSPKTAKNTYSLLMSAIKYFDRDASFKVSLPKLPQNNEPAPDEDDVVRLFREANPRLKLAIALAAFASLRRSEICALKHKDLDGNVLHVHAAVVRGREGNVFQQNTKTSQSDRYIVLPQFILDMIEPGEPDDLIVGYKPSGLSRSFLRLRNRLGLTIRFHDLRHYFASICAVLGVPDIYTAQFGGWRKDSGVMKNVYQQVFNKQKAMYSEALNDHFSEIVSPEFPRYD